MQSKQVERDWLNMIRRYILALFVLLGLTKTFDVSAQVRSWADLNLNGKVKKIVVDEYPVDDTVGKKRKVEYQFDLSGRKISEILTDESGNWLYKDNLSYHTNGKLAAEASSNRITFHVDMVKKYSYNKNKQLVRTRLYNCYNHLINITTFTYNDQNLLTLCLSVNDVGMELERKSFVYDQQRRLIEEQMWDQGAMVSYTCFEYDDFGRKISKSDFDKRGLSDFILEFSYDIYGNVSSELSSFIGGLSILIEYQYDYDQHHNWIRMREIMNGRTFAVSVREIEYFN